MSTAVTRIQLKYSTGTAAPTSLVTAEPAYSYASNTFFIGSPSGDGVIAIGGKFYLDQQQLAWNHANASFAAANNVFPQIQPSFNTANAAFIHANAAFNAANNATDTYVRNHANAAFDTANGAVAVNLTQNNSITVALNTANASYSNSNSYITYAEAVSVTQNNSIAAAFNAANAATATDVTQNNSIIAAFVHANAAFASANNIDGVNVTQNNSILVALNTANAAYTRANNSLDANNGGTITGDVIINANLFVNGTTTYVNTVNQLIGDNIITLNADIPQDGTPTQDAGFEIDRGLQPNSSFLWIESAGKWAANNGNASIFVASEATLTAAYHTANAASIRANNSLNANTGGLVTGNISVDGTITPNADVTWNLGSPDKRWHSLFVGAGTIDIGGLSISNAPVSGVTTAQFGGVQDIKITDAAVGSFRQVANTGNAAFNSANAAFANSNTYITYAEAVSVTQNTNITAATNAAAAAFIRANNSLDANNGGAISGSVNITSNVYAGNVIANSGFTSTGGTSKLELTDIGLASIKVADQTFQFGASGIESNKGMFGGSFGGNRLSLDNETNLISNRYDTVKIQTGTTGTVVNEFVFSNNSLTVPGGITANGFTAGGINVVPTLAASFNTANAAFAAANAATATDTTQNNSITASFAHANAAFLAANTGAATAFAFNQANSAFNHANAGFTVANSAASAASSAATAASNAQGTADGAASAATAAQNTGSAAFNHANSAFATANNVATATASVFNTVGDGTTKSFNLGFTPVSDGSASVVSIDGIIQYEGTWTITTGNSSINFSDAPDTGERIRVLAYTSVNPYVLGPTGVSAGDYGNANTIAVFRTAANGQLTFASNVAIAIGASQITSGTLDVARGGTGAGTFTTNGVLIGQGTSAFTTASSSTEGHVLAINSSGAPVFTYINGGTF
jgi:hypothetical protein